MLLIVGSLIVLASVAGGYMMHGGVLGALWQLNELVIIGVHVFAVKHHGIGEYLKGYLQPYPVMAPLTILEELIKPFTLALRLFGNIFAGGIMLSLITLIPVYALWAPNMLWKAFDMFIGGIQAFIFALLTVLYFAMAGAGHDDHAEHDHDDAHDTAHDKELAPAH